MEKEFNFIRVEIHMKETGKKVKDTGLGNRFNKFYQKFQNF